MDEVEIEIKEEFIPQDEELQTKNKYIASSSEENTNVLNKEVHIKDEPIDQEFILPSTDQENSLVKSDTIEMKMDLKTEVKQESFGEFEAHEQGGFEFFDLNCPSAESELNNMKAEVKTEIKEEPFKKFESREQDGINFITSKDFDQNVNEPEFPTQKTDFALKRKIREEPNESNVPLKKFKKKGSVHQSMSIGEEFDTNIQSELNEKPNSNGQNQTEFSMSEEKPKLTYAQLIAEALSNASEGMLILSEIYRAISSSHPYYKLENTNWQKSIRCQLTKNKCFAKAERSLLATGHYWKLSTIGKKTDLKMASAKDNTSAISDLNKGFSKCRFCPERIAIGADMNAHVTSVHAIKCKFCPAKFMTKMVMDQHIKCHEKIAHVKSVHSIQASHMTSKKLNTFLCFICSEVFQAQHDVNQHISKVHRKNKLETHETSKTIDESKKNFSCPTSIQPSQMTSKKSFPCFICSEVFQAQHDVNQHISKVHRKNKLETHGTSKTIDAHVKSVHAIKCRYCLEKFVIGADMNAHVTSVHATKCEFCPAKFLTKKDMEQHESTTGHKILDLNKPFPTFYDHDK